MYGLRDVRSYPGEVMTFTTAIVVNSGCGSVHTLFSLIGTSLKLMAYLADGWYHERVKFFHLINVNGHTHSPCIGTVCSLAVWVDPPAAILPALTCFGMDAQRALEEVVHSTGHIHVKSGIGELELDLVNELLFIGKFAL